MNVAEYRALLTKGKLRAKGRHKPGEMNKAEAAYAAVLYQRRLSGEVIDYWFEAMTFKLALDTRYTPDFIVLLANMEIECHEVKVKAIFQDDAKVKIKVAASMFPFRFLLAFQQTKKDGGGFEIKEVSG